MKLNKTGSPLTRQERNELNKNWETIENNFNNVVDKAAEKAFDKVIDGSRIDWSEIVESPEDLPDDAEEGSTRGVVSDNRIYRFDGTEWVPIAEINLNPISEVEGRLNNKIDDGLDAVNQQLEEKADQSDLNITNDQLRDIKRTLYPLDIDADISDEVARDAFINEMNKKAEEIGMASTNFINPSGLRDENQVTTAKDMILMGLHALKYRGITESWSKRSYHVDIEGENARSIDIDTTISESSINENYNINGGKTGTLSGVTKNLLSLVNTKKSNDWFIGCVLDAIESRYRASRELFDISNTVIRNKQAIKYHVSNLRNGNFDEGLDFWGVNTGNPTLTREDYFSFPQSLKANSTGTSSQIRRTINLISGNIYYVSAMVKCTRHSAGSLGVQITATSPSTTIGVDRTTNGWERVSAIIEAEGNSAFLYAGGISSANLDGYVDMVNVINLTSEYGAGNEPSKNEMDSELWREVAAENAIVCQVPAVPVSYDPESLPVLFEKNADEEGYPASLVKIMTSMVLLDNSNNLDYKIEINESDLASGSGPTFQVGDVITLKDALHLMMLPSSNTVANAVARVVGRKVYMDSL